MPTREDKQNESYIEVPSQSPVPAWAKYVHDPFQRAQLEFESIDRNAIDLTEYLCDQELFFLIAADGQLLKRA